MLSRVTLIAQTYIEIHTNPLFIALLLKIDVHIYVIINSVLF